MDSPGEGTLSPNSGPSSGGTDVKIVGTNFMGATGVQFGSTSAPSFSVVSPTEIDATSPAGSSGPVDVQVTTPQGTSPASGSVQFTYSVVPVPTVISISPTSGPTTGGTTVTITGTNFTGATAVDFGTMAATSFSVSSSTSITAVSPAARPGNLDVTVTT
ncbi:MAG TPA: IPT/TIG domain-containing protein, partial [Acidimicrobiales bacterium]|nr:IPT/TIG domain-containing protein [Acidimicrobiales bacterium]